MLVFITFSRWYSEVSIRGLSLKSYFRKISCGLSLNTTFLCSVFVSIGIKHGVLMISKLTKTSGWRYWRRSGVFIVNLVTSTTPYLFWKLRNTEQINIALKPVLRGESSVFFLCFSKSVLLGKFKDLGRFLFCIFLYLS